jgi:two-component system nitrogen regulation response regulator GlnG
MDKLLLIDDEADVQYSFRRIFDAPDLELHTASSGEEGLRLISEIHPDLVLSDIRMAGLNGLETLRKIRQMDPRLPVILMTAYGTTQMAIEAMKLGAYDYLLKPFDVPKLKHLVFDALKAARDMRQAVPVSSHIEPQDYDLGVIGRSESMQKVFKLIGQVSPTDATVLITGESGTGKEVVARAIFHNSRRSQKPFLAINCAAIPENLLESELFGHEKGAFTGATQQRLGKFEQCDGGTLFLDEIGDMSGPTQTKILRVLQNGTFERVGGNQPIRVDVRIIAATNKPLEAAVANRQFREDLFYRLNVVRILMPTLRERRDDIRLLSEYFLRRLASPGVAPKSLSAGTLAALEAYHWPGNVRELENVIRRATVVAKSSVVVVSDLPMEVTSAKRPVLGAEVGVQQPNFPTSIASPTSRTSPSPAPSEGETSTQGPSSDVFPATSVVTSGSSSVDSSHERAPLTLAEVAQVLFRFARADSNLRILPAVERELVIQALRETDGNQVQAAKLLGITRATLRKRVEKFGIRKELTVL